MAYYYCLDNFFEDIILKCEGIRSWELNVHQQSQQCRCIKIHVPGKVTFSFVLFLLYMLIDPGSLELPQRPRLNARSS